MASLRLYNIKYVSRQHLCRYNDQFRKLRETIREKNVRSTAEVLLLNRTMTKYTKSLYGGALAIDLPVDMVDASTLRQIPDTQEVFVAENGSLSVIIDLLESVEASNTEQRLQIHFDEINSINGVRNRSTSEDFSVVPNSEYGEIGIIQQTEAVKKFGKETHEVNIAVGVIHLSKVSTDIVITMNSERAAVDLGTFEALITSVKVNDWNLFA